MIDTLDTAVGAGMVGACGNFVDAEVLVEGAGEFGAELKSVLGKTGNRGSLERDVPVSYTHLTLPTIYSV